MTAMPMTPEEIRASYREARYPKRQIRILAELNLTSTDHIKQIVADVTTAAEEPKRKCKKYTEAECAEIGRLWSEGLTIEEIALRMNRDSCAITAFSVKHRDLCPIRTKPITPEIRAEIIRRRQAGESYSKIAKAIGCASHTVYRTIQQQKEAKK